MIEGDDRGRKEFEQFPVEFGDLLPIGVGSRIRLGVYGGDGCLELIWAWTAEAKGAVDELQAFLDLRLVPKCAILLFQRHQFAAGADSRIAAGIVKQHEGKQT